MVGVGRGGGVAGLTRPGTAVGGEVLRLADAGVQTGQGTYSSEADSHTRSPGRPCAMGPPRWIMAENRAVDLPAAPGPPLGAPTRRWSVLNWQQRHKVVPMPTHTRDTQTCPCTHTHAPPPSLRRRAVTPQNENAHRDRRPDQTHHMPTKGPVHTGTTPTPLPPSPTPATPSPPPPTHTCMAWSGPRSTALLEDA